MLFIDIHLYHINRAFSIAEKGCAGDKYSALNAAIFSIRCFIFVPAAKNTDICRPPRKTALRGNSRHKKYPHSCGQKKKARAAKSGARPLQVIDEKVTYEGEKLLVLVILFFRRLLTVGKALCLPEGEEAPDAQTCRQRAAESALRPPEFRPQRAWNAGDNAACLFRIHSPSGAKTSLNAAYTASFISLSRSAGTLQRISEVNMPLTSSSTSQSCV